MNEFVTLTDYQTAVLDDDEPRRILIGGRQIGKTEAIVRGAAGDLISGRRSVVLTPTRRQCDIVRDRIVDQALVAVDGFDWNNKTSIGRGLGEIQFRSTNSILDDIHSEFDVHRIDTIYADEANYIQYEHLHDIEHTSLHYNVDAVLTATPRPPALNHAKQVQRSLRDSTTLQRESITFVEAWARWSDYWHTVHASTYDAPFVSHERIGEWSKNLSPQTVLTEVHGKYE